MSEQDRRERRIMFTFWGVVFTIVIGGVLAAFWQRQVDIVKAQERTRIIQEEKTKRTKERSDTIRDIVPWSKRPESKQ